jgi:chorismate dehydratase
MLNILRISAISYLNTVPMVWGIKNSGILKNYRLTYDVPSTCAQKLTNGEADIGIVPVAAIPGIPDATIASGYCIGAVGPVKSVLLVSLSPLEKIKTLYLDPDSRTSVRLVQILASEHWHIAVDYKPLTPLILRDLPEGTGAVIIGDKTFGMELVFPVVYDLASEWQDFTGLPFVFACWVSRGKLPPEVGDEFDRAVGYGVENIRNVIKDIDPLLYPGLDIESYLRDNISFPFDAAKKAGLEKFLSYLK